MAIRIQFGPPTTASSPTDHAGRLQARFRQGLALHNQGQREQARLIYLEVLKTEPRHFDALHMLAVIAAQTGDPARSLELIDLAIQIRPGVASTYSNRGNALSAMQKYDAAIESYDQAIALKGDHANAHANRGKALRELKQYAEAIASFDRAIAIRPDYADAYFDRGLALQQSGRYQAAITAYKKALGLSPHHATACRNCGVIFYELNRHQEAIEYFDRAIAVAPNDADAHANRGAALIELKQYQSAVLSYDKAIALRPGYDFLHGRRLHAKMRVCDWTDHPNEVLQLMQRADCNERAAPPFAVLALSASLPLQRKVAESHVEKYCAANGELGALVRRVRAAKIRIGYFSADFHNHATTYLIAELFERHDRNRFELVAFSFGPDRADGMRYRVSSAFDKFMDVRNRCDQEIAGLARSLEIDIGVDLKGFTQDSRPGIFARRAAPLQVSYLGYPGTMGAEYMDYLIADKVLIPEDSQHHYFEKIAYLPNSYQVNDGKREIADEIFSREELGLPSSGFVFCCFNNNYKITPDTFDGWMRILRRVDGSVLWLLEDSSTAGCNLRREAQSRGVNPQRLVFAQRLPLREHLARHRAAGLFLDTLPCNAHTTASDALWAGLPVLTCPGDAFASRVAASLLAAIELPELITRTADEYEALAVGLATDPVRLNAIRQKLDRNRLTTPLFDAALYARHIEEAYTMMMDRYHAGLPIEHIYVDS